MDFGTGSKDHVDRLFLLAAFEWSYLDSMDYSELRTDRRDIIRCRRPVAEWRVFARAEHRRFFDGLSLYISVLHKAGELAALVFAAIIIVLSYGIITLQFIVAMVESYIIVAAGFIFVGFGGSRWTVPYTERYIGLAVSTGVKIMLLYLLIEQVLTSQSIGKQQLQRSLLRPAP